MTPQFQPIGKVARWRILYDLFRLREVDSVVTYAEMARALGVDPDEERHLIQVTMRRTAKELLLVDDRAAEVVRNTGYRLVLPGEHLRLAQNKQRQSHSLAKRGKALAEHVDLTGMEPQTRHAFEVVAQAFSMQIDLMRRLDVRQSRLEQAVQATHQAQQKSASEIASLRERLERLEQLQT